MLNREVTNWPQINIRLSDQVLISVNLPKPQYLSLKCLCLKGLNFKDNAGIQEDEISEVMEYLFVNDAASGDVIIQQGDEGDNFYIIDQVQHILCIFVLSCLAVEPTSTCFSNDFGW